MGCRPVNTVHITDQLPMLALMQQNIAMNNLQDGVKASVYDWGGARPEDVPAHPDVILVADCVYFEPAFPLLHQTLEDLIGPDTICYFCFKKRRRADVTFLKAVRKTLAVEDVSDDPDLEVYARENITLYAQLIRLGRGQNSADLPRSCTIKRKAGVVKSKAREGFTS